MNKWITIGMVEDLKDIRERIKQVLDDAADFLCVAAYDNAEDALEGLPALQPDIVLMDINLPGMSGITCIRKLKEKCPYTQFMMFTVYEDSEQVFDALSAGATGYLLKKTPPDQILHALKELREGGAPMSTHIARKVVSAFQKTPASTESGASLSERETQVLQLLSKGYLYKEIGEQLKISTGTVRQHIHKIYEKLQVQNRTEALNKYYGRR
jgi:DNA-binding NarL/FixJ family response regulator